MSYSDHLGLLQIPDPVCGNIKSSLETRDIRSKTIASVIHFLLFCLHHHSHNHFTSLCQFFSLFVLDFSPAIYFPITRGTVKRLFFCLHQFSFGEIQALLPFLPKHSIFPLLLSSQRYQQVCNSKMRTEQGPESKTSWPNKVVRKWLNLPTGINNQFNSTSADKNCSSSSSSSTVTPQIHGLTRRKSCSDKNDVFPVHDDLRGTADNLRRNRIRSEGSAVTYAAGGQNHRMFVGTWNVGGRAPHDRLNLRDWLCTPAPSDIYVLGFQEIVPLNAGNVLGTKDRIPAATWIALLRQALNFPKRPSNVNDTTTSQQHPDQFPKPRVSFSDLISVNDDDVDEEFRCYNDDDDEENGDEWESPSTNPNSSDDEFAEVFPIGSSCRRPAWKRERHVSSGYRLAASKQMVGIFLCVWVRGDLFPHLSRVKASCVARGVMGYMGNKGSISISMTLRDTTFCFVCTHLTSGEKERDEIKRNSDVVEILKRTRFKHSKRSSRSSGPASSPKTILEHDKIIWFGDLNYRLTSSCEETHTLLNKNDWNSLLEMDQLRIEQKAGRIFEGWEEGKIYFAPTYKYLTNSDCYAVQTDAKPKHKRRTPAWCDRILWRGEGMKQIYYVRGESKFSDHRPVYSVFSVYVADTSDVETTPTSTMESIRNNSRTTTTTTLWNILNGDNDDSGRWPLEGTQLATTSNNSDVNTCGVMSEVLFPITRTQSCIETPRFRR